MSKIFNRYEHYKTPFGEMIFDRQTHSLLNKETHEVNSNEIKTSPNDVLFAIFPNQILSHIHLPSWLITVSIISSFIIFIVLAVLFPKWIYPFQKKDFWPVIFIELPILIVSILLHELSHAVIATGYGGFVAEIGIRKIKYGFKYYTRVFWGNVPINNKICFLLGGIAMNMWLSSFGCFIVYRYKLVCGFFVYITNVLLVMLNIIPQKKLNSDGYQIVVQLQKYKKNNLNIFRKK